MIALFLHNKILMIALFLHNKILMIALFNITKPFNIQCNKMLTTAH